MRSFSRAGSPERQRIPLPHLGFRPREEQRDVGAVLSGEDGHGLLPVLNVQTVNLAGKVEFRSANLTLRPASPPYHNSDHSSFTCRILSPLRMRPSTAAIPCGLTWDGGDVWVNDVNNLMGETHLSAAASPLPHKSPGPPRRRSCNKRSGPVCPAGGSCTAPPPGGSRKGGGGQGLTL